MIETHINDNTLKVHVLTLKLCNEKELSGLTNVSDLLWPVEALDDIFPYHKQYILKIWYFKDKMNLFFLKTLLLQYAIRKILLGLLKYKISKTEGWKKNNW